MVTGMSPLDTTHVIWAKSPESTIGEPKENGAILGGSKGRDQIKQNTNISSALPCDH